MKSFATFMAVCLYTTMLICIFMGYDKINNYKNSDIFTSQNTNAYVGGDAYNYIINANYASGYYILAIGAGIMATMFLLEASRISRDGANKITHADNSGKQTHGGYNLNYVKSQSEVVTRPPQDWGTDVQKKQQTPSPKLDATEVQQHDSQHQSALEAHIKQLETKLEHEAKKTCHACGTMLGKSRTACPRCGAKL